LFVFHSHTCNIRLQKFIYKKGVSVRMLIRQSGPSHCPYRR